MSKSISAPCPGIETAGLGRCTADHKSGGQLEIFPGYVFESYHFASLHPTTIAIHAFGNVLVHDRFGPHHRVVTVGG